MGKDHIPFPRELFTDSFWNQVKAGVEFKHARYNLSTVANSFLSTSDWSMMPLEETTVRVRVEREVHEGWLTPSLWVYLMRNNGEKQELREVTWVRHLQAR